MRASITFGVRHGSSKREVVHHPDEMGIQEQRNWVFSQPDPHPDFERFEVWESDASFTTTRRLQRVEAEPKKAKK